MPKENSSSIQIEDPTIVSANIAPTLDAGVVKIDDELDPALNARVGEIDDELDLTLDAGLVEIEVELYPRLDFAAPIVTEPPPTDVGQNLNTWSCRKILAASAGLTCFSGINSGLSVFFATSGARVLNMPSRYSARPAEAGAIGGALISPIFFPLIMMLLMAPYSNIRNRNSEPCNLMACIFLIALINTFAAPLGNEVLNATTVPDPQTSSLDLLCASSISGAGFVVATSFIGCQMMNAGI